MLLMIDNYDSFTFNLVQYFGELGEDVRVVRNDAITLDEIAQMKPDRLVLSPGPCSPAEAGICVPAIQRFVGQLPILGVCLGHQSIGAALGGKVVRAGKQMHGKTSTLTHDGKGVYQDLPNPFTVIRYHSLVIERASLPDCLEITSTSEDGEIMGVRLKYRPGGPQTDKNFAPLEGVQFHPESILTEHGHAMLKNFLQM
ncbi:aminodeoxychorismate/anthranilate synthase component II [Aquabacterium sp.]|uniref:aminodeoxychorismate/anthranilate synthase component II n=1 Tax=Aquabacterium sp. TaxID=1872578 RepID=UPI0035B04270